MLKPLQDILNKTSNDENLLIVLHTYGSHSKYDDRYTKNFKKFGPTCSSIEHSLKNKLLASRSSCNFSVEASNSYDNTILYTDYFLSQVINILKPYKSMMMYVSDHGESLGENGIYLHGYKYDSAPKEQLHVPYMIWFSHEFLNDKKIASNLKVASENIFKKIDQSSVFHSLLDCINVDSDIIDNKKSVCSSSLGEGNLFGRKE